jgi:hypothetical protein
MLGVVTLAISLYLEIYLLYLVFVNGKQLNMSDGVKEVRHQQMDVSCVHKTSKLGCF